MALFYCILAFQSDVVEAPACGQPVNGMVEMKHPGTTCENERIN